VPVLASRPAEPASAAPGRAPASDPQADRVVLLPTAYTHPRGTVYFSNYDILFLQIGYALTDATQATLTVLPVTTESAMFLDVSLKSALLATGPVRVAVLGSASGAAGKSIGVQLIGRAGGVAQACLDGACDSSLTLSSNVAFAGALVLMVNGAGAIVRVTRRMSLLGELATALPLGTQGGQFNGAIAGGGIRLCFPHVGFDFTLVSALETRAAAVPFLVFTYRS
jgi:hypothetical protein